MSHCPCGNSVSYQSCCQPIHANPALAKQPEQLMRARYCAHELKLVDFVINTYHPSCNAEASREGIVESIHSDWCKLEVIGTENGENTNEGYVSFKAYFIDDNQQYCMQEKSRFVKQDGLWFYIDGVVEESKDEEISTVSKVGRNAPCPCGSGKKSKKCCH
ncbi:YchJ family metal-binding protein [Vibrio amylolyticus]|uniref:YchJ family metal-binding protein n=1 Tax=Vibrio amylolyticus TaxID=2847292 RepID=UPI0035502609